MPCNCCEITDNAFGEDEAKSELRNYRKHGPAKQTKLILEAIRSLNLKDADLLDIGGGIGAIHHELLKDVARARHTCGCFFSLFEGGKRRSGTAQTSATASISSMLILRMSRRNFQRLISSRLIA